jgi:hypothetical protein
VGFEDCGLGEADGRYPEAHGALRAMIAAHKAATKGQP